jgi:hypothetical protein
MVEYEVLSSSNFNISDSNSELNESIPLESDNSSDSSNASKTTVKKRFFDLKIKRGPSTIADAMKFYSSSEFEESTKKLVILQSADDYTRALAFALNQLEGYIYSSRDAFTNDEELRMVSTAELLESIESALQATEDWIYENEETENPEKYDRKLKDLKDLCDPAFFRKREMQARPRAISTARDKLSNIRASLSNELKWQNASEILAKIDAFEDWLKDREAQQESLALTENPAVTSEEIYDRLGPISTQFEVMRRKPKPRPKPKPKVDNSTQSNATDTQADENDDRNDSNYEESDSDEKGDKSTEGHEKDEGNEKDEL